MSSTVDISSYLSPVPAGFPDEDARNAAPIRVCVLSDLTVIGVDHGSSPATSVNDLLDASPGSRLRLKGTARARLSKALSVLQEKASCPCVFVQLDDRERNRSQYLVVRRWSHRDGIAASDLPPNGSPLYVITYRDLTQRVHVSMETLGDSFDLTPMEARLCIALLNEQTLQDFADDCGLAIATVRWHWGNVREKLDVRTQLGLVRMLMRLALS